MNKKGKKVSILTRLLIFSYFNIEFFNGNGNYLPINSIFGVFLYFFIFLKNVEKIE